MPRWADEYEDESNFDDDWDSDDDDDTMPCPSCGADVYVDAPACPACGDFIVEDNEFADEDRTPRPTGVWADRPAWWIWLGVLGIIATIFALI